MSKKIHIKVRKGGVVEISGSGFTGDECSVIRDLGEKLGVVRREDFTPEYYQQRQEEQNQQSCGDW